MINQYQSQTTSSTPRSKRKVTKRDVFAEPCISDDEFEYDNSSKASQMVSKIANSQRASSDIDKRSMSSASGSSSSSHAGRNTTLQ